MPPADDTPATPRAGALRAWALGLNVTAIADGGKEPDHEWNSKHAPWATRRQPEDVVRSLPWRARREVYRGRELLPITRFGVISGIGDLRTLDLDARPGPGGAKRPIPEAVVAQLLDALGLPPDYAWHGRSASGTGWHVIIRCAGELPDDVVQAERAKGESGVITWDPLPAFAADVDHIELRWERCQTVLPHPYGYTPTTLDAPPVEVSVDSLVAALRQLATPRPRGSKPASKAPAASTPPPPSRSQGDADVIGAFNARYTPAEILERNGYTWNGDGWYHPHTSQPGTTGVKLAADGKVQSFSATDPVNSGHNHDAFSLFTLLEHDGNVAAAVAAAAADLGMPYLPHGAPAIDEQGWACCPAHGTRLRPGRTSGWYCPTPDASAPRGWCAYWWPGVDYAPPATPAADGETAMPGGGAAFHRTDLGNAKRLVARHGANLRYVPAWATWLVWDGTHWEKDETGAVQRLARETVMAMYAEIADQPDRDARKALAKWAAASESRDKLSAMVALAQAEPGIYVRHEDLNADPYLLGCGNGTLDLRTGALARHDRAHFVTKQVACDFDPAAACPTWQCFIDRVFAGDAELIAFVQRAVGYTLTADTREQCLFFLYGTGRNGKSTFVEALQDLFGDYALKAPTEMLMAKPNGGGIPNDVAKLPGARLVVTAETEEGRRLNESLVKDLTGGDRLSARFMRSEYFEFKPTHKLWMYGNHKPVIRGTDSGIWRRMRLVPFLVTIPEDEQDRGLAAKLRQELPGILAWAVAGCLDWQRQGLGMPDAVRVATETYRAEMDVVGAFLEECCVMWPTTSTNATDLYRAYTQWAEQGGEKPFSQRRFGALLTERGILSHKDGAGRILRIGVGLRAAEDRHAPVLYRGGAARPEERTEETEDTEGPRISPHVNFEKPGDRGRPSVIIRSSVPAESETAQSDPPAPEKNGAHPAGPPGGASLRAMAIGEWSAYDRQLVEQALALLQAGNLDKARRKRDQLRSQAARAFLDERLPG